jgi:F420-dependent oxidoreductase-like protein
VEDVRLGLTIADFTWPAGGPPFGEQLRRIATTAEDVGFARLAVMDHVWQIPLVGPPEQEMVEAYTTLGFLASATRRVELLALVTSVMYRAPGLLAKMVTTLDVLSGGRAWLGIGIGAGFNRGEADGLGLPFAAEPERFSRLEEAVQICLQMWGGDQSPYRGTHYRLARTLNSPAPVSRPHPRILIGGSGERRTLRLVARYADACNLFAGPDLERKLAVLRRHCDELGRDYDAIEKTVLMPLDPGPGGRGADRLVATLTQLGRMGIDTVYGPVPGAHTLAPLETLGRRVIPAVAGLRDQPPVAR